MLPCQRLGLGTQLANRGLTSKASGGVSILSTCGCRPVGTEALGNGGATRLGRSLGPCMEEHLLTAKWTNVKGRNMPCCVKPLRFRGSIALTPLTNTHLKHWMSYTWDVYISLLSVHPVRLNHREKHQDFAQYLWNRFECAISNVAIQTFGKRNEVREK